MIWMGLALTAWACAFAYGVNRWALVALTQADSERAKTLAHERAVREMMRQPSHGLTDRLAQTEQRLALIELALSAPGHRDIPPPRPGDAEIVRPHFGQKKPDDHPPTNGGAA